MGLTGFVIIHVFIASFSPAQGERNQIVNAKFTRPVVAMPMSTLDLLNAKSWKTNTWHLNSAKEASTYELEPELPDPHYTRTHSSPQGHVQDTKMPSNS